MPLNPETLKAMKESAAGAGDACTDAIADVLRYPHTSDKDTRQCAVAQLNGVETYLQQCSPANVSALIAERDALAAEVERQAGEIEELNQQLNQAWSSCALVDCPARQDD